MNKTDLIALVADKAELTKVDAEKAVEALLDGIVEALARGEEVKISGFGIFSKKVRAARDGTNPSTQVKIHIPASSTVSFKVSKPLKEKLNK